MASSSSPLFTSIAAPVPVKAPPYSPSFSVETRQVLEQTKTPAEVQMTVCGMGRPLRVIYGHGRVGALLLRPVVYQDYLYVPFVIGRGAIQAVTLIEQGDEALPAGVTSQTYLGVAAPSVDSTLVSAWAANGATYADTLPNIAWGWVKVPSGVDVAVDGLTIEVQGMKIYDPRDGTQTLGTRTTYKYSTNAVLILADFLSATYGRGETLDWTSFGDGATIADQTLSGQKRRSIGISFDAATPLDVVEGQLETYAGGWVVREGGVCRFVADGPTTSVYTFTNASGSANYILDSIRIAQRPRRDTPTAVTVQWTDKAQKPWAQRPWTEHMTGVDSGMLLWREQTVPLPGIQDAGMARREALRRLNEYIAADLTVDLVATDPAIQLRRGDMVSLTDSDGFTLKQFRLVSHRMAALGRWNESLVEYDAALYWDSVATGPSTPDSSWALPSEVPAITGLALTEEVFATLDKTIRSRIRATWNAPTGFPYPLEYLVEIWDGSALVDASVVTSLQYASPALQEAHSYTVRLAGRCMGFSGAWATAGKTVAGKALAPPDVATFTITQVGSWVLMNWSEVVDVDSIKRYEIRRWPGGGSWATGTRVDAVNALALRVNGEPAGAWTYGIVAVDSTERPSTTPKTVAFTVATDPNSYLVSAYVFTTPTLANMTSYALRDGVTHYVTNFADQWGTLFPNAMSTYPNPVDSYHTAGTSSLTTEWFDAGIVLSGQWTGAMTYTDDGGTATVYLDLSVSAAGSHSDAVAYSPPTTKGTARYARMRIVTTGAANVAGMPNVSVIAEPRTEVFSGTSNNAAPVTITLTNKYFALKDCRVNVQGATPYAGMWNNLVLSSVNPNTLDVRVFDQNNTQVNGVAFTGSFEGISY